MCCAQKSPRGCEQHVAQECHVPSREPTRTWARELERPGRELERPGRERTTAAHRKPTTPPGNSQPRVACVRTFARHTWSTSMATAGRMSDRSRRSHVEEACVEEEKPAARAAPQAPLRADELKVTVSAEDRAGWSAAAAALKPARCRSRCPSPCSRRERRRGEVRAVALERDAGRDDEEGRGAGPLVGGAASPDGGPTPWCPPFTEARRRSFLAHRAHAGGADAALLSAPRRAVWCTRASKPRRSRATSASPPSRTSTTASRPTKTPGCAQ